MKFMTQKLQKNFFSRDAKTVAKELLGKILVRKINGKKFKTKIVETEAYFGKEDCASRASKCRLGKNSVFEIMWGEAGRILVYNVHKYIMFCIVTGEKNKAEAILIRALEPLDFEARLNGPGLLTNALKINKTYFGKDICSLRDLWIEEDKSMEFEIVESFRIGVKKDLPEKLRFYIRDNNFVSRKN